MTDDARPYAPHLDALFEAEARGRKRRVRDQRRRDDERCRAHRAAFDALVESYRRFWGLDDAEVDLLRRCLHGAEATFGQVLITSTRKRKESKDDDGS